MPDPSTELAAREFTPDKIELIRRQICQGATDDELSVFLHVCKRTGLDPLLKQIYLVKRKGKMCVQVGIDGYRLIADRTGKYAGNDDPIFDDEKQPRRATVTVYKVVAGVRCPFTSTARWSQYYPGKELGFMWDRMPHLMLGKCAEGLALRKAFPAELGAVYTEEELVAEDPKGISPAQIQKINEQIEACQQADRWSEDSLKKLLAVYEIESLDELPPNRFLDVMSDLSRQLTGKIGGKK